MGRGSGDAGGEHRAVPTPEGKGSIGLCRRLKGRVGRPCIAKGAQQLCSWATAGQFAAK